MNAEEYEIRYLQSPHLMEHYPRFDNCNQYIFDSTGDYLLSVVNELDLHNLHLCKTGLYEIAKVHGGKLISEPIRNLTVDEILDIVNKENEYGSVETRRLPEDEQMAEVTMTLGEYQDLEDKLSTLAIKNHNLKKRTWKFL